MSAAPPNMSANATIRDWPASPGDDMVVLRAGSNSWTCLPETPESSANDPMCLDQPWLDFMTAFNKKEAPVITQMGFGYMLQTNDLAYSNTDPFATEATADNEWQDSDTPHIMILVPDAKTLDGLPTDPIHQKRCNLTSNSKKFCRR